MGFIGKGDRIPIFLKRGIATLINPDRFFVFDFSIHSVVAEVKLFSKDLTFLAETSIFRVMWHLGLCCGLISVSRIDKWKMYELSIFTLLEIGKTL